MEAKKLFLKYFVINYPETLDEVNFKTVSPRNVLAVKDDIHTWVFFVEKRIVLCSCPWCVYMKLIYDISGINYCVFICKLNLL